MGVVAVVGAGVMGEALLSGLLRGDRMGDTFVVADKRHDRVIELHERYGVDISTNVEAAREADVVVLVVKPQDLFGVVEEIAEELKPGALVVSLAAGVTTASLEQRLPEGTPVVRVMPNTPALVDQGMSAVSPGSHCKAEHVAMAVRLMGCVGKVVEVPERQQDAITAISGSGPAYIFFTVEAMIEAGVGLGLPRRLATELTLQTVYGAATMLRETGEHPVVLRENVTSPAGTTAAALRILEDHKVRAAFLAALEAARDRSVELAAGS
ncbi:MAG TPA: pyrroline-5-carboxylate reductase [Actinomycetota bacterium]|nr:pyrroline-5-carboxylate reductase [Actinomycetota bacterium]